MYTCESCGRQVIAYEVVVNVKQVMANGDLATLRYCCRDCKYRISVRE